NSAGTPGALSITSALPNSQIGNISTFRTIQITPTLNSAIAVNGNVSATGTIKIQTNQNISVATMSNLSSGGSLSLISNFGTLTLDDSVTVTAASGTLTLQGNNGISIGSGDLIRAGLLKPGAPVLGVLTPSQIKSSVILQI